MSFPDGSAIKNPPASTGDTGSIPRSGRSAGVGNGCYTSILAWQIPWTEEPGRLQSMRSKELCVYTHTHTHRSWSKSGPKVFLCEILLLWIQLWVLKFKFSLQVLFLVNFGKTHFFSLYILIRSAVHFLNPLVWICWNYQL